LSIGDKWLLDRHKLVVDYLLLGCLTKSYELKLKGRRNASFLWSFPELKTRVCSNFIYYFVQSSRTSYRSELKPMGRKT
jgi:hypothetical protein